MNAAGQRGWTAALLALSALLAALVVAANHYLVPVSALTNPEELRADLMGYRGFDVPATWVDEYLWRQEAPHKYRILGKLPLWAVYALQRPGPTAAERDVAFFRSFLACSFGTLLLALAMLAAFARRMVLDTFGALPPGRVATLQAAAMAMFALCAPVLLFAKFAIHGGPNDFLGYFLMLAGLHLAWRGRLKACCAVSALAVFCRETTLLVPFLLLFYPGVQWRRRALLALLPVLRWRRSACCGRDPTIPPAGRA
ncbi:MAG: hypothetical protein P4L83_00195 [Nevskia sp.]|nr:hypothetical protein [Nevskia sp.]